MEEEESPSEAGAPAAPANAEGAPPRPDDAGRPEGRPEYRGGGGGGRRPGGGGGGGGRRGGFIGRRKVCAFCVDKIEKIDYKEPMKLRRYVSDRGKIEPRRKTGTCARHQRRLTIALKRARHLALLPYTSDHIRTSNVFPARTAADRREA